MGSIPEIFPPRVLQGYNQYKVMFAQESAPPFEYTLQFSVIFRIPWIMSFTYKKKEAEGTSPPSLLRQYSVKWWKQVQESQADEKAVIAYHNSLIKRSPGPSTPKSSSSDAETIQGIKACKTDKEYYDLLNEIRSSPTPSEDIFQDSQDPYEDENFLNF
ncbi:hypothetical protein Tco_1515250 [Tanacetum coccineum]